MAEDDVGLPVRVVLRTRPVTERDLKRASRVPGSDASGEALTTAYDAYMIGEEEVYAAVAPLLEKAKVGHDAACVVYGATGSGKTTTMLGGVLGSGLVGRAVCDLLEGGGVAVEMCVLELYLERVLDLTTVDEKGWPGEVRIRSARDEDDRFKVDLEGAKWSPVQTEDDAREVVDEACMVRLRRITLMSARSSRSSLVVGLRVTTESASSVLWMVDMAGAENEVGSAVCRAGVRLREAKNLHRSLTSLQRVVLARVSGAKFVPVRDSKLTRILASALMGDSCTVLVVTLSPADVAGSEKSLAFAARVRQDDGGAVYEDAQA